MSTTAPVPSAASQLEFLTLLQRLFSEGDFTATYKFALLIALADLAVEACRDDGEALVLTTRQIAHRFIDLYWRHCAPYSTGTREMQPGILSQNRGEQAAVLTAIANFRKKTGAGSLHQAMHSPDYPSLLGAVAATVSAQPLKYLQNFGGKCHPFLCERYGKGSIRIKPGAAYCLRRFYPLVQQLARAHWISHIKSNRRNHPLLEGTGEFQDFQFSTSRQSLAVVGEALRKIDGCRCFYCGRALAKTDVDHYIPFSSYPRDLAQNFVLAHPACNRSKSDTLAGMAHLERWLERLQRHADALAEIGLAAGIASDTRAVTHVAAWAYGSGRQSGAQAWLASNRDEPVGDRYLHLLGIERNWSTPLSGAAPTTTHRASPFQG